MREDLVVTVIGIDRPGLVEAISKTVSEHQGNWEGSRMARMAGRFAGILRVTAPSELVGALEKALHGLEARGLRVVVERSAPEAGAPEARTVRAELVGQDRQGVIHDVSRALAQRSVNILELETNTESAPMSGEPLLKVRALLACPRALSVDELRRLLESTATDFMVEVAPLGDS